MDGPLRQADGLQFINGEGRPQGRCGALDRTAGASRPATAAKAVRHRQATKEEALNTAPLARRWLVFPYSGQVKAPHPKSRRGLRGLRLDRAAPSQVPKCGCRAAQASMAQDMPRSSWCPGGHL